MAIQKIPNTLIADNAVTAAKIANGSLTADDISNNSITAAKLSVSTSPTFANLTTTGTINGLTLAAGSVATSTSQNFALNTPNSLRINIDSNNSNAGEIFAIGHNQTGVDASNNVLFLIQAVNARAGFNATSLNADLHIGSSNAVGDATNPAFQIGGASTYRLGMYTGSEDAIIENKNGDDGIAFRVKTKGEAMRIDGGTGNVGIGEASPDKQLHIKDSGAVGIAIESTDNAQNLDIDFYNNVGSVQGRIRYAEGAGSFGFAPNVSASDALHILYGGDVGIGTSSPDNILHIKTTAAGGPQIHMDDGTNSAFINFDGQSMQISTQRDMVDGTWHNTSRSWGGINIVGHSSGSYITFQTAPNNNTSPSERLRIQANGGISFNGDTAAANALDDYEEGTWTPACGATLSTAVGTYTKIGNQITVHYHIVSTGGLPSSTGQVQISGLPFASASNMVGAAPIYARYYTPNDSTLTSIIFDGESVIRLINTNDQNFDYTIWGELEASSNNSVYIIGTATYQV